jgi:hypothetical protein
MRPWVKKNPSIPLMRLKIGNCMSRSVSSLLELDQTKKKLWCIPFTNGIYSIASYHLTVGVGETLKKVNKVEETRKAALQAGVTNT